MKCQEKYEFKNLPNTSPSRGKCFLHLFTSKNWVIHSQYVWIILALLQATTLVAFYLQKLKLCTYSISSKRRISQQFKYECLCSPCISKYSQFVSLNICTHFWHLLCQNVTTHKSGLVSLSLERY